MVSKERAPFDRMTIKQVFHCGVTLYYVNSVQIDINDPAVMVCSHRPSPSQIQIFLSIRLLSKQFKHARTDTLVPIQISGQILMGTVPIFSSNSFCIIIGSERIFESESDSVSVKAR